ncbi:MAG: PstS family phosphate ABC transporter substrate-binding protein [Lawsonibacter sp.]|jgi:phosphate transport system substrate-binding protein
MKMDVPGLAAVLVIAVVLTSCTPSRQANTASSSQNGDQISSSSSSKSSLASPFVFTRENFPRLDGSTSTAPLAETICAVLLGENRESVADLIHFSRTTQSYRNLMAGERDLVLAAEPEGEVLTQLEEEGHWLYTPFATDALVFVVNADNPVDNLTWNQVQKIYTGEITNWKEVGGDDLEIVPFQRNQGAGSQTMFEKLVMQGQPPMPAPEAWVPDSMVGLMDAVRAYDNSPSAIGYTVYYYANDMEMARGLKVLSIDGVAPDTQSIRNGTYPFLNPYFIAIDQNTPSDSPTRILYDWVLGVEGQKLAAGEGYVPVLDLEE